jgi:YggT family protein
VVTAISIVANVLYWALTIFVFCMWGRLVVDFIRAVRPDWRPTSVLLVVSNAIYTITDPPMKLVRRWIRPVSFGTIALDFGWTIVLLAAIVAMYILEFFL